MKCLTNNFQYAKKAGTIMKHLSVLFLSCLFMFYACKNDSELVAPINKLFGSKSSIFLTKAASGTKVLFGPEQFVRGKGKPVTETRVVTNESCVGLTDPFVFRLRNGNSDGTNRVSSATITLDNEVLFGPSAFSQQVAGYDVEVTFGAHSEQDINSDSL